MHAAVKEEPGIGMYVEYTAPGFITHRYLVEEEGEGGWKVVNPFSLDCYSGKVYPTVEMATVGEMVALEAVRLDKAPN